MKRKIMVTLASGALLLAMAAPASAISDEQACEAEGGTYVKEGGTAECRFPVGKSDNVKTTSQKGSFESSHGEEFTNPGGNQPSGKQGGDTVR